MKWQKSNIEAFRKADTICIIMVLAFLLNSCKNENKNTTENISALKNSVLETGTVTTHAMYSIHGPLFVNVDASKRSLRTELLDVDGNSISGYTLDDCLPIQSNGVSEMVQWFKHTRLPDTNKVLCIHFQIMSASLYVFYAGIRPCTC